MTNLEKLQKISADALQPSIREPFRTELDDGAWNVATDGWRMLAFPAGARPRLLDWAGDPDRLRVLLSTTTKEPASLVELREFCGPAEWPHTEECAYCLGDGRNDPEVPKDVLPCPECGGAGTVRVLPDGRYGWVLGCPLNTNLLAGLLEMVTGETCVVRIVYDDPEQRRIHLTGDGWKAVLMGVRTVDRTDAEDPATWPRFGEPAKAGA